MKKENFNHLLGKTRNDIKNELGDGFNYFNSDVWTYEVAKNWLGRRTILSLTFKDNAVFGLEISKTFSKH